MLMDSSTIRRGICEVGCCVCVEEWQHKEDSARNSRRTRMRSIKRRQRPQSACEFGWLRLGFCRHRNLLWKPQPRPPTLPTNRHLQNHQNIRPLPDMGRSRKNRQTGNSKTKNNLRKQRPKSARRHLCLLWRMGVAAKRASK